MKRIPLILLAILVLALPVGANVPTTINIQGVLVDDEGATLPDGDYNVQFVLWSMETDGEMLWSEYQLVTQSGGVFNALLGFSNPFDPGLFNQRMFLSLAINDGPHSSPRIPMASVATALRAGSVDRGAAVLSLNGMTDNVTLQAGTNVSIAQQDSTLVISATGSSGGEDSDWVINGDDITHELGRVIVGTDNSGYDVLPPSKVHINANNEGLVVHMYENNANADGRAAIFGTLNSGWGNDGTAFGIETSNSAIVGYNRASQDYTFGLAGYSSSVTATNTAGVLGKLRYNSIWGALAFADSNHTKWGVYTPSRSFFGDTVEVGGFKLANGAQSGYLLTSDADGNASWAAPGAAGGDDGDWNVIGEDISRPTGTVWIGQDPPSSPGSAIPPLRGQDVADRDPTSAKLFSNGDKEGFYSIMRDSDDLADGRHAIFARRLRTVQNPGTAIGVDAINSAITGYNDWGDSYTFGVAGFTWFDFNNTGAVLGSRNSGTTWASLAFRDDAGHFWGMYTPNNAHVGGDLETSTFKMSWGAAEGYILTSDADGNALWTPPGATSDDGDWTLSGNNMYHAGAGAVAIGTTNPHPWADQFSRTTMQVQALFSPTLALDRVGAYPNNQLYRWTMSGGSDGLKFNLSQDYADEGTTALHLNEGLFQLNRATGQKAIVMEGDGVDAYGPSMHIYSTSSATNAPLISLDPQSSSSSFGGSITLRDGNGNNEVLITANHNHSGTGRVVTPVLEITGGSDLSEQFDLGNTSALTKPGMVVSIDPENPGQLTLCDRAYDRRVAGVISGAGGVNTGMVMGQQGSMADGEHPVALVGRVYVWADASDSPIEPGDLLTTSDNPGHAMKVSDHDQATGAILGKAMTGLSEGQGLILTLVTLQ